MVKREGLLIKLLEHLLPQCEDSTARVEVVGLQNSGERTLAEYREMLLRDARGEWLCFIDDDDWVEDNYVEEIVKALRVDDPPDVVTFMQDGTGTAANVTLFGLRFLGAQWQPVMVNGIPTYLRVYSHVCPIRSEVARQGTFLQQGGLGFTQEDVKFAQTIVPVLLERGSREVHIPATLYSYRWMFSGESTQQGRQPQSGEKHERPGIASPCFRWYEPSI